MKIILINGKKRAGKDFFAEMLQSELQKLGKSVRIMRFADPLKDIVATTFGISHERLDELKNTEENFAFGTNVFNFRQILQRLGTDSLKKYFGDDVWVRLLKQEAQRTNVDFVIVPDFRFKIEDIGDFTINIYNKYIINSDTHTSETELDDFNFCCYINNTGQPDLTEPASKLAKSLSA